MNEVAISPVDILFADGSYPIEFLFYYRKGFPTRNMRRALGTLSELFWPMFGEYQDGRIFFDAYREEDIYEEDAGPRELDIAEMKEAGSKVDSRYRLPALKKLFFLKVHRGKNGLALVPKMNHVAGDGYSDFYFLSLLAALSRPTIVPFKSSLMTLVSRPHHRRRAITGVLPKGASGSPGPPIETFAVESESILRTDLDSAIAEVAGSHHLRISPNDLLTARAIKKLVVSRRDRRGEDVSLTMPLDIRRQIQDYGRRFFGNGIMFHALKFKTERIENSPATDIAVEIRRAKPSLSKESYARYLTELEAMISEGDWERLRPYDPESGCLVTNLSRLPADQLDFGTGPPELMIPLTIEKNSAAILANRENYVLRCAS